MCRLTMEEPNEKNISGGSAGGLAMTLSASAFAADVTMRISLQLPMKSHLGQDLALFKDEVESKSGGDIVVEIYDRRNFTRTRKCLRLLVPARSRPALPR